MENLFTEAEADVLRNGDKLIVRLLGLRFASNSARLSDEGQQLLARLETAVEIFPRSDILVEGHSSS